MKERNKTEKEEERTMAPNWLPFLQRERGRESGPVKQGGRRAPFSVCGGKVGNNSGKRVFSPFKFFVGLERQRGRASSFFLRFLRSFEIDS